MTSFFILNTRWDNASQTYKYKVFVNNPFFLRMITIGIKPVGSLTPWGYKSKLELAFLDYPKAQIDSKLDDLQTILERHFGTQPVKMVSNRPTNMNAYYLREHQDTKNVANHKIRDNAKREK